jgi:plastocyanin
MSKIDALRPANVVGLVTLLAFALVLAACGNEASATPVQTSEVTMPRSYRYAPETIQVTAGTTVTWRNEDNFTHSVRLLTGDKPDHHVKPGESTTFTFSEPGTYPYDCSLHPRDMRGTVIVTAAQSADGYGDQP